MSFKPNKIIVHHAGVEDGASLQWAAIRDWHINHNGWLDIGYHAGVELVGVNYEGLFGRPWDMVGAHTLGQNEQALGICFVGDFNLIEPPEAQLVAGAKIIKTWMWLFNIPVTEIWRHKEFNDTDCPGSKFNMARLRELVRAT